MVCVVLQQKAEHITVLYLYSINVIYVASLEGTTRCCKCATCAAVFVLQEGKVHCSGLGQVPLDCPQALVTFEVSWLVLKATRTASPIVAPGALLDSWHSGPSAYNLLRDCSSLRVIMVTVQLFHFELPVNVRCILTLLQ